LDHSSFIGLAKADPANEGQHLIIGQGLALKVLPTLFFDQGLDQPAFTEQGFTLVYIALPLVSLLAAAEAGVEPYASSSEP